MTVGVLATAKICSKCKIEPAAKSHNYCRPCKRAYDVWRYRNVPKEKEARRSYVKRNPERARQWRNNTYKRHREKFLAKAREYRKLNAEKIKARRAVDYLKRRREYKFKSVLRLYGITRQQYDQLLLAQNGLCAVCVDRPATQVDHCHQTDKFRGLLCNNCNLGIGLFKENLEALTRAVEYLRAHRV